jgi:hypothetical protein
VIADRLAASLDDQLSAAASVIGELDEDRERRALTAGAMAAVGSIPAAASTSEALPFDLVLDAFEVAMGAMFEARADVLAVVRRHPAGDSSADADDEA